MKRLLILSVKKDEESEEELHTWHDTIDAIVVTHTDRDHDIDIVFDATDKPRVPPRVAETLVQLLAPKKLVDPLLGDLQEKFEKYAQRHGIERARRYYWTQVVREIGPIVWRRIKRLGIVALVIDYARSKLGF